jgi:Arc/MetJ-type ribon-helix-helix transcriptional regulator
MSKIQISSELVDRIEDRIEATKFESVDEYTEFILSEVIAKIEHGSKDKSESTASEDEIEKRLQSLGYLEE